MRETSQPGSDSFAGLRIGRHGMAECDAHASLCELADKNRRHLLRRQGDKRCTTASRRNQIEIIDGGSPDETRRVDASLFGREERTFEVNTKNTGFDTGERL